MGHLPVVVQCMPKPARVQGPRCGAYFTLNLKEHRPVLRSNLKADASIDHRHGIRVQGEGCRKQESSGLFADQLYWTTTKVIAPALRFGLAVDGGG